MTQHGQSEHEPLRLDESVDDAFMALIWWCFLMVIFLLVGCLVA